MQEPTHKTALLIGATGLVGGQVLHNLLNAAQYTEVKVLTRRSLGIQHTKLQEIIFDFEHPDKAVLKADDVFCCLGTTIKKAGSQEAFKKVDLEYPAQIAEMTKILGAEKYIIVTAMGADSKSVIFYNRVKGEVQDRLTALKFDALHILQPSLILGDRGEARLGEKIGSVVMKAIGPVLLGSLKKYRAIESSKIARAMVVLAQNPKRGVLSTIPASCNSTRHG